jgi:hypothetical protein
MVHLKARCGPQHTFERQIREIAPTPTEPAASAAAAGRNSVSVVPRKVCVRTPACPAAAHLHSGRHARLPRLKRARQLGDDLRAPHCNGAASAALSPPVTACAFWLAARQQATRLDAAVVAHDARQRRRVRDAQLRLVRKMLHERARLAARYVGRHPPRWASTCAPPLDMQRRGARAHSGPPPAACGEQSPSALWALAVRAGEMQAFAQPNPQVQLPARACVAV